LKDFQTNTDKIRELNSPKMTTFTQVFHYKIIEELSIENLDSFKEHRRLRVFHQKGTTCVWCGKTGTRLIKGEGRGIFHWDVYTEDLYPLTVDHIIPVSLGGSDDMNNLQPMCAGCNFKKGNGFDPYSPGASPWIPKGFYKCSLLSDLNKIVGKNLYKRTCKKGKKEIYKLGIAEQIIIENSRDIFVKVAGESRTYKLKDLFIQKEELSEICETKYGEKILESFKKTNKTKLIRISLIDCDLNLLIGKECFKKKKGGTTLYKLPGVIKEFKMNPFIDKLSVVIEGLEYSMFNLSQIWIRKSDVPLLELTQSANNWNTTRLQ
jgi:hypothetical protein